MLLKKGVEKMDYFQQAVSLKCKEWE